MNGSGWRQAATFDTNGDLDEVFTYEWDLVTKNGQCRALLEEYDDYGNQIERFLIAGIQKTTTG